MTELPALPWEAGGDGIGAPGRLRARSSVDPESTDRLSD
jgi:hypothetical protein